MRCSGCGKTIGTDKLLRLAAENAEERKKKLRKRPRSYDRRDFWTRVLRSFPALHLSAALRRARHLMGISSGLVTSIVREEMSKRSILLADPDDKRLFLHHCLRVWTAGALPPIPDPMFHVGQLDGKAAEACWKAIWRARATAALLRDSRAGAIKELRRDWSGGRNMGRVRAPRSTAFKVDDLRTGLTGPMPGFLDWFAPEGDPWRPLYPASPTAVSRADVERFPDLLKEAFPDLSQDLEGFRWLQEWRSPSSMRQVYTRLIEPKAYQNTYHTWLRHRLPPGVDPDMAFSTMQAVFEQVLPPHVEHPRHDLKIDAGLSYILAFREGMVECVVATRRRTIGHWQEQCPFPNRLGSLSFRPVLNTSSSYLDDDWFTPDPGNISLKRLSQPYPPT